MGFLTSAEPVVFWIWYQIAIRAAKERGELIPKPAVHWLENILYAAMFVRMCMVWLPAFTGRTMPAGLLSMPHASS